MVEVSLKDYFSEINSAYQFSKLEHCLIYLSFKQYVLGIFHAGFKYLTRPKPVEHSYVFSMAVGTIWEWMKLVPFIVRGRTVDTVDKYYGLGP